MISSAKKPKEIRFLPDIEAYLESIDNNQPVSLQGLDGLVDEVTARTRLTKEQAQIVIRLFFQEIRNCMLRNIQVTFRGLGSFEISSPKSGNVKRVFAKFNPSKMLIRNLNDGRNKNI